MSDDNKFYKYLPDGVSFTSNEAVNIRRLYMPLTGITDNSIISSITPNLSGDIKVNKLQYITKPVSREDLLYNLRNVFIQTDRYNCISVADISQAESSYVDIGQLWHKLVRQYDNGLKVEVLNFVPVSGENIELMKVLITNTSNDSISITPTIAIPLFARALANKHDHEHVTSLLNCIEQLREGVMVSPTMIFDEEGHKSNETVYYVLGSTGDGKNPVGTYPTIENFLGESGTLEKPEAIVKRKETEELKENRRHGQEAMGALRFAEATLVPSGSQEYIVAIGLAKSKDQALSVFGRFNTSEMVQRALNKNNDFWKAKASSIVYGTQDSDFNSWMQWVDLQPVLRRICGCSFLPDHDYGKGGRGWRDLWQDLLSLILIEPEAVRNDLIKNFGGIRVDGSNATIIGSGEKPFIADRNAISRVWMDHGAWPFLTLLLYIHQSGDFDVLFSEQSYFRDPQLSRAIKKDILWNNEYGNELKDQEGKVYRGTILEHVLVQHLTQFFNVGEHNIIRLEGADWNDGLDMARTRGESVAFTSFYGGNLMELADLLENSNQESVVLAKELLILLDSLGKKAVDYNNLHQKKDLLFNYYFEAVQPQISGEKVRISTEDLVKDLRKKGKWIFEHIRRYEKVNVGEHTWINGYYDESGSQVEGEKENCTWMTLTGQVFPIMSGLANSQEIKEIKESVEAYLKDKELGGYRLNTDFGIHHYLDLGRAFGFAYGTKENGAFFSHMNVMYAYALYKQGFARDGFNVLNSIYKMSIDTDKSKIYPGIPEYFDSQGRGLYHYLTGSASWYILTMLTQAFGIRGYNGDLFIAPKLVKEQFDDQGRAFIITKFSGKEVKVTYVNPECLDFGQYKISDISMDGVPILYEKVSSLEVQIKRMIIEDAGDKVDIKVMLD